MVHSHKLIAAVICFLPMAGAAARAQSPAPLPARERIQFDHQMLQIDSRDTFVFSGAFHYFRCPRELWPARFQKVKDAGFNAIETYAPWNWHERTPPSSPQDFSKVDLEELDAWLAMAEKYGLYTIVRPGPYICAEWDGGGIPQWLVALKMPAAPRRSEMWLQTDDPVYLAWAKHWYDAVCPVIARHQITRKPPGSTGVIMVQIENEYNRLRLPSDVKTAQLVALADAARAAGIDVPIVTCWTDQTRNSEQPSLRAIFDFVNCYPKWDVAKQFGKLSNATHKAQPNAPLMSMELQGGWYSEVGKQLSRDLDGTASVQTQNLTLYALQSGYSFINYYMLVGGTNFDDWASRNTTTTYDYGAAIGEDGSTGDRYDRLCAIGEMLKAHGVRIVRAETVKLDVKCDDPAVQFALRVAVDGTRYVFVRTEDRRSRHAGIATLSPASGATMTVAFDIEPFGSKILCLPAGVVDSRQGDWLPREIPKPDRPAAMPAAVDVIHHLRRPDPMPTEWTSLAGVERLESLGVFDRHFIYYRAAFPAGQLVVRRTGDKVINGSMADGVLAWCDGQPLAPAESSQQAVTFNVPAGAGPTVLLYENAGLHHHTNKTLETFWAIGLQAVEFGGKPVALEFTRGERERGLAYSDPAKPIVAGDWTPAPVPAAPARNLLLGWDRFEFSLPVTPVATNPRWHLRIKAKGNGFVYLNGHCIGRYWQSGPQYDFYLPECWLRGGGERNVVAVSLRPLDAGAGVDSATIVPGGDR